MAVSGSQARSPQNRRIPGAHRTMSQAQLNFIGQSRSLGLFSVSLTPASVAANTSAEQAFTVTSGNNSSTLNAGLTPDTQDLVMVNGPSTGNATFYAGFRINSSGQLVIRFGNPTAGALTPAAGTFLVFIARPTKLQ